jgi:hypothetical protein
MNAAVSPLGAIMANFGAWAHEARTDFAID